MDNFRQDALFLWKYVEFLRQLFRTKLVHFSATVIFFENIPFLEFQRKQFSLF